MTGEHTMGFQPAMSHLTETSLVARLAWVVDDVSETVNGEEVWYPKSVYLEKGVYYLQSDKDGEIEYHPTEDDMQASDWFVV